VGWDGVQVETRTLRVETAAAGLRLGEHGSGRRIPVVTRIDAEAFGERFLRSIEAL
jgi:hypothetical protein